MEEKEKKEKKAKESINWDQRILRSEKMKDLCADIINDKGPVIERKQTQPKKKIITEVIVE